MFDVAASMRTGYHPEFRAGFNEGYTATSPLTPAEVARIKQYLLMFRVIDALADVSVDRESLATSIKHATATLDA
jgi:Ser/Thr protein kinase RdoA (MazF antagonist)